VKLFEPIYRVTFHSFGHNPDIIRRAACSSVTGDRPRPAGPGLAAKLTEVLILTVISSSSSSAVVRSSTSSMHQNTPSDELTTPVHMHTAGSTARTGRPFTPEPAGRTGLREARAAPADTPAELLGSLPAPASSSILTRTTHTAKHVGWQAVQPERQQVQLEPCEAAGDRPDRRISGCSGGTSRGVCAHSRGRCTTCWCSV
jgi:hypothetical protein